MVTYFFVVQQKEPKTEPGPFNAAPAPLNTGIFLKLIIMLKRGLELHTHVAPYGPSISPAGSKIIPSCILMEGNIQYID